MEGTGILLLLLFVSAYWITPIILIIVGIVRLKKKPENAKKLFIIASVMFLVGGGVCSFLLTGL